MEEGTQQISQSKKTSPWTLKNIATGGLIAVVLGTPVYFCGNRIVNFNQQNARHVEQFFAKQGKNIHIHHVYMTNGADGMQYYRFEATDEHGNSIIGHYGTDIISVRDNSIYLE